MAFMPEDILLVCSDGLYEHIESISILDMLTTKNTIQKNASKLLKHALKRGSKDNITLLIIKVDRV